MIAVKHQSTARTHMSTSRKTLVHPLATARTILGGEVWGDGHDGYVGYRAVVAQTGEELPPRRVTDALCQVVILDEVGYLECFVGNQVVRRDERTCGLGREVFTLPRN